MEEEKSNQLHLIVSRDGRDQSLTIHQDVDLYASLLTADCTLSHSFRKDRKGWLQVVLGDVAINEVHLVSAVGIVKIMWTVIETIEAQNLRVGSINLTIHPN